MIGKTLDKQIAQPGGPSKDGPADKFLLVMSPAPCIFYLPICCCHCDSGFIWWHRLPSCWQAVYQWATPRNNMSLNSLSVTSSSSSCICSLPVSNHYWWRRCCTCRLPCSSRSSSSSSRTWCHFNLMAFLGHGIASFGSALFTSTKSRSQVVRSMAWCHASSLTPGSNQCKLLSFTP